MAKPTKSNPETTEKNPVGQPPKYTDPEVMRADIQTYFKKCDDDKRPKTIMGLALALDMTRETLCQYAKNDAYSDIVKRAKNEVVQEVEERLLQTNGVGSIFWLKNFGDMVDKKEVDMSGELKVKGIEVNFVTGDTGPSK